MRRNQPEHEQKGALVLTGAVHWLGGVGGLWLGGQSHPRKDHVGNKQNTHTVRSR